MLFITQGKTNWKFIAILVILAVIVGGGILLWIKAQKDSLVEFPEIERPERFVEEVIEYSEERLPRFEDFPILEKFKDEFTAPDFFSNPDASKFVTRITEGVKEGVNFAQHYAVIEWGCGTNCQSGVIVDAKTGTIYKLPVSELGREFRINSNLLIVNPSKNVEDLFESWSIPEWVSTRYYQWENNQFELIYESSEYVRLEVRLENETADWLTYRNEEYGFEVKYPKDIIAVLKEDEKIVMTHSIPFEHSDPCDFKGDAPPLEKLTDFEVSIGIVSKSLRETVIANEGDYLASNFLLDNELKIEPNFIDEFVISLLRGYRITKGVEGCGEYTYYFPLSAQNTLVVKRAFITELQPVITNYKEYLNLPGVIPPDKEEKLFNQMLSTFRFSE